MTFPTGRAKDAIALATMLLGGFALGQSVALRSGAPAASVTLYEPVVTMVYADGSTVTSPVSAGEPTVRQCMDWRRNADDIVRQVDTVVRANFECRRIDVAWHRASMIVDERDAEAPAF